MIVESRMWQPPKQEVRANSCTTGSLASETAAAGAALAVATTTTMMMISERLSKTASARTSVVDWYNHARFVSNFALSPPEPRPVCLAIPLCVVAILTSVYRDRRSSYRVPKLARARVRTFEKCTSVPFMGVGAVGGTLLVNGGPMATIVRTV